jgi:hypothetical protein
MILTSQDIYHHACVFQSTVHELKVASNRFKFYVTDVVESASRWKWNFWNSTVHGWAHPGICPPRPCPCSYTIMYNTVMYVFGSVDPRRKLVPVRRWTGGMSIFSSMTLCRIRAQLRDGSSLFGKSWQIYCFILRFPATSSLIRYLREWRRVVIADL